MKKAIAIAFLGVVASSWSARADIDVDFGSVTPGLTTTVWSYTIDVTSQQEGRSGNYFTIYDFGNIIPNSNLQPAGWTLTTSLLGQTPDKVNAPDDPNILNLTWTYNGTTIPTDTFVGPFSVEVAGIQPQFRATYFAGLGTMSTGPAAGLPIANIGLTVVPQTVPEPSTLALIAGMGGLGMIGRAVARRRKF